MAAVTPDTVTRINLGAVTAYVYELPATTDDTNTITTGIPDIRWVFASQEDTAGTQGSTGCGVSWVQSTGVITVHAGEDNSAINLLVLAGGP